MYQVCTVVFCVLSIAHGSWLDELSNDDKGIELGNGFKLHVDKLNHENGSAFTKHALRLNYGKFGLSLRKSSNADALHLGLYEDDVEGRGKKINEMTIPAIIGFKVTAIVALLFSFVGYLVLKLFAISNLSVAVALGVILSKFLSYKSRTNRDDSELSASSYYSPVYAYPSAMGYNLNNVASFYPYSDPESAQIQHSESKGQYSVVEAPAEVTNATGVLKRVDNKRKHFFYSLPVTKFKFSV